MVSVETNKYRYEIYNFPNEQYPTVMVWKKTKTVFEKDALKKVLSGKRANNFIIGLLRIYCNGAKHEK